MTLTEVIAREIADLIQEQSAEGWEFEYRGREVTITGMESPVEPMDPRHSTFHIGADLPDRRKDYRVTIKVSIHESRDGQGRK